MAISAANNGQNNSTSSVPINICKFIVTLCLSIFCFLLFIITLCQFRIPISDGRFQRDGSSLIAFFLLAIAIISFIRFCRKLRRYSLVIYNRNQHTQLNNLALSSNNNENTGVVMSSIIDLPSYKALFPSQSNISDTNNNPLSTLLPPSYDDFLERLAFYHRTTSVSPSQCIWITDPTQRPFCTPSTVTYL